MGALETERSWEDSLVTRLRQRDANAVEELVRVYSARLRRVAVNILHNADDAEDVVHQSLWKAYQCIGQYDHRAALCSWLMTITRNESFGLIRRRAVEQRTRRAFTFMNGGRCSPQTPEQMVLREEVADLCRECIACLLPNNRTIVTMRLIEERSNEEIARHLRISVNAVKIRYHRGSKQLRLLVGRKLAHAQP
jgi:RNA polymerase sigma factor (sigma-70 family)